MQKRLAEEVTLFVHGQAALNEALATTQKLFASQNAPAESMSIEDLEAIQGVIRSNYSQNKLNEGVDVVSFLAETGVFPSKGEARKMVQGGGISINRKKVEDQAVKVDSTYLLHSRYILVQKGKKNYYLVVAEWRVLVAV